jgi:hypothetical protein
MTRLYGLPKASIGCPDVEAGGGPRRAEHRVHPRLKRGDFNLGRIGDERQRENLVRKYVGAAEALRGFGSELKLLERARESFALQWQERLRNNDSEQIAHAGGSGHVRA